MKVKQFIFFVRVCSVVPGQIVESHVETLIIIAMAFDFYSISKILMLAKYLKPHT